ncbi:phage holin family protein [Streptomyces sp. MUM 203J]|uniref:phage holin family protein n=1 Tax=Streptomyces sp. MUM 203J TaxID=2791990 RepID=UPI001F0366A2|nr:phage holin family protein [Streptomyces sp. MUM 203J]MCH0539753.1 phage holin family protein [Streptomyces sp. MUM 203J]
MSDPADKTARPGSTAFAHQAGRGASRTPGPDGEQGTLGGLVAHATAELSALVHDEIALAKAQLRQDVRRGVISSGLLILAAVVLIFSLPMLSFALAYGFEAWTGLHLSVCFVLSFGVNVIVAALLGLAGFAIMKKAKQGKGPQKTAASVKETAAVLQNAKPHPRPDGHPALEQAGSVARSSA